eukprot:NODE_387_length_9532_cov_0.176402.p9 type:complete len:107 gc:universal NODE_387_length_9532_cov_0.176402:6442-6762(+)
MLLSVLYLLMFSSIGKNMRVSIFCLTLLEFLLTLLATSNLFSWIAKIFGSTENVIFLFASCFLKHLVQVKWCNTSSPKNRSRQFINVPFVLLILMSRLMSRTGSNF